MTDISVNVHYQCLLLLILSYTNADLKICRSIRLNIEKYAKISHYSEAATKGVLLQKVFLEILLNSQ